MAFGSTQPSPKAVAEHRPGDRRHGGDPAHASAAITTPAAAPIIVPPAIIVSMPRRGPRRTDTRLPAIRPVATAPKQRPYAVGDTPRIVMSAKDEPVMNATGR